LIVWPGRGTPRTPELLRSDEPRAETDTTHVPAALVVGGHMDLRNPAAVLLRGVEEQGRE